MMLRNASTSYRSQPSAAPSREPSSTRVRATLWLALALGLAACGGGSKGDSYAKATQVQEACCENLTGTDRDQCLASVVKVDDPEVAKLRENQQSYACVQRNFVCDPQTGHATAESVQNQYDCIAELQQ